MRALTVGAGTEVPRRAVDEIERATFERLADEPDLCCEIGRCDGERMRPAEQVEQMRRRVAELEPLFGGDLERLLAAED